MYDNELEPPSTLLWTQAYLAQHYDHLSDYTTALQYVDEALEATPTLPELHMIRGRIYKVRKRSQCTWPIGSNKY